MSSRRGVKVRVIAAVLAAAMAWNASAAPHEPPSESTIVERLPPAFIALKRMQRDAATAGASIDARTALANARRYVELGQTSSDPRAYGYAQSALGKWWTTDPAPTGILVMRARILQFRHEFGPALAQLEAALQSDQFDPDAWLLLASISQVQGNIPAARSACLKLIPIADPLIGAACVASTAALSGRDDSAAMLLANALREASAAPAAERVWAWTTLAEMRERGGNLSGAKAAFDEALRVSAQDVYTRAAYADVLLDQHDWQSARAVLGDASQADALLLRAAIAAQRSSNPDAGELAANLAERFTEARSRGDDTHLREQARFALEVQHDAAGALQLAQRNFGVQQEPADARILLEAALAACSPAAASPAIAWLQRTDIHAPRLQQLADEVERLRAKL